MSVRKNIGLIGTAQAISFILNFSSVVILSRLLTPEEVGIYSVSVAILGLAHVLRDFGASNYLVQLKDISSEKKEAAFTVSLISSWFIALSLFLLRTPLADLYGQIGIYEVLTILSVNFILLPFGTPIIALMQRDLQFGFLSLNTIFASLIQTSVTIYCAMIGESYLSMAWGALAAGALKIVWLNYMRPGEMSFVPRFKGIGEAFSFGSYSSLASIFKELGEMAPDMILGKTLGFSDVGLLSRAKGLQKMLVSRVVSLVQTVYFPTLSSEIRKGSDGAKIYTSAIVYLSVIIAPMLAFLAVTSESLILFLFGEQWQASAKLASILCIYSIIGSPYSMFGASLIAKGKVKENAKIHALLLITKIVVFSSSIIFNLEQVVICFGLVILVNIYMSQSALNKHFELNFFTFIKELAPSAKVTALSCLCPIGISIFSDNYIPMNDLMLLVVSFITSLTSWIVGIYIFNHPIKNEVDILLKAINKKRTNNEKSG